MRTYLTLGSDIKTYIFRIKFTRNYIFYFFTTLLKKEWDCCRIRIKTLKEGEITLVTNVNLDDISGRYPVNQKSTNEIF